MKEQDAADFTVAVEMMVHHMNAYLIFSPCPLGPGSGVNIHHLCVSFNG
jgi:hypothetical protein